MDVCNRYHRIIRFYRIVRWAKESYCAGCPYASGCVWFNSPFNVENYVKINDDFWRVKDDKREDVDMLWCFLIPKKESREMIELLCNIHDITLEKLMDDDHE